ncbi:MAG: rubrerythrin family protein [Candidatus Thermoplasmatota archaeon]|nr:rubrerythrin family protein [Candidatus Thermoplasmatota archaeon]MBS3790879.1 rubrerythrin family protein [Candidatus Thermoplasmatota archaeon]
MGDMTKKSLEEAFEGESMAHMRYLHFSDVAEEEGKEDIARLFRAIAYAERVHAGNHYEELGNIGDTVENLKTGIDGEDFEVKSMYPAYHAIAELEEEYGAQTSINYALEAEKIHREMYTDAKEAAKKDEDIELDDVYICPKCGYTHEGKPPEKCPVCGLDSKKFKEFSD